jgi:hypothetical protein
VIVEISHRVSPNTEARIDIRIMFLNSIDLKKEMLKLVIDVHIGPFSFSLKNFVTKVIRSIFFVIYFESNL